MKLPLQPPEPEASNIGDPQLSNPSAISTQRAPENATKTSAAQLALSRDLDAHRTRLPDEALADALERQHRLDGVELRPDQGQQLARGVESRRSARRRRPSTGKAAQR
jgi:hypothetical protein